MKSINFSILVFFLGILSFSSCKKEEVTDPINTVVNSDPYESISNLTSVSSITDQDVSHYEPVKQLILSDGYLSMTNVHYNNGDIGIQFDRLNSNQEVVWSKIYLEATYQNQAIDLVEAQNKFYAVSNSTATSGTGHKIQFITIEQGGSNLQVVDFNMTTSNSFDNWVNAIHYDADNSAIVITGTTTNVDATKPEHATYVQEDTKDIFTARLDLSLSIVWSSVYGFTNEDAGYVVSSFDNSYLIGGIVETRSTNTTHTPKFILMQQLPSSGNIINTQTYDFGITNLGYLGVIADPATEQFYLFVYETTATNAVIKKITVDQNLVQVGSIETIDLGITEAVTYHAINVLSDGNFLVTLEAPNNTSKENTKWVKFNSNGSIQATYSFDDLNQEHTEGIGSLSNATNSALATDNLVFPLAYSNKSILGAYSL